MQHPNLHIILELAAVEAKSWDARMEALVASGTPLNAVMASNPTPADVAAVNDVLKEVWVTDTLKSQLYDDMVLFDYIEDVTEYTDSDGLYAKVPLKTGRTGGVGSRALGEPLPDADRQKVGKATYNYQNHYLVVAVNGPLVARMRTNRQSAVREIDFEVTNGIEDLKHMLCRQLHGDGTGNVLYAGLPGNASAQVIPLGASNFGVLERGHLYEGMRVDIGTAANPTLDTGRNRILSINDDPAAPTITLATATAVTAGSGLSLHGNRTAGGISNEMNGLRSIISDTSTLGGINPATYSFWKAARVHNSGGLRALSIDLMLQTLRKLRQKGSYPDVGLTDLVQEQKYYQLLAGQVRFMGDKDLTAGNTEKLAFARMQIVGDPEARPNRIDFIKKSALQMYSAGEIAWQNTTSGGDILAWQQGYDAFIGRAAKYCQLGTDRRNSFGSLEDLAS